MDDARSDVRGPSGANLLEVIRSMLSTLRKSDRKVASCVERGRATASGAQIIACAIDRIGFDKVRICDEQIRVES